MCGRSDSPPFHVGYKFRYHILRLAQYKVPDFGERRMAGSKERPAGDDRLAEYATTSDNRIDRVSMYNHGAEHHVVGPANVFVTKRIHVRIDQLQFPFARQHGGHGQ
jgi:hypothetical protein